MTDMLQPPDQARHGDGPGAESEFSIAQSNTLVPLLILFGATVLVILWFIIRVPPYVPHEGAVADKAYRPADFPMVFAKDEALAGLESASAAGEAVLFPVPAPPFSEGIFPCSQCHGEMEPNPERRPLEAMHSDIVLRHDEEHRWCLDCHDMKDRDHLRLASGTLVPFTESYRLCGQCHGTQFRDWRTGIHGKRTGYWSGPKRYLLCVNCHNPHSPHFAPLKPLPPPVRPQYLRPEEGGSAESASPAAPAGKEAGHAAHAG